MNNTEVQKQSTATQNNTPQNPSSPQPQQQPTLAQPLNSKDAEGFNLIPAMSEEEKVKVKTKNTLNIGSVLSIIALASIAIGIVGFNILSKAQLNSKKSSLFKMEKTINSKMDKIIANNAIVERARMYEKVKKDSFSHKKTIEFFSDTAARIGGISFRSIDIAENLSFEISGVAPNLEQVSRIWYLYGVNENVKTVNLDSVNISDEGARFSFTGELYLENFSNE